MFIPHVDKTGLSLTSILMFMIVEEGELMREDFQNLLNAVEKKRDQLYQIALCMDLTSEEVVTFSCELDKLINEVYISEVYISHTRETR